jgi:predicted DNA-binding protein
MAVTYPTTTRLDDRLRNALKDRANDLDRSLSWVVREVIEVGLHEVGYLASEEELATEDERIGRILDERFGGNTDG